jgi:2'-5' RNA ligase
MENHFWWRPGWAPKRPYLTWHVLPDSDLWEPVREVQDRLSTIDHLAVIPSNRLHITGPGVGFEDEIPIERVSRVVETARQSLSGVHPFVVEVDEPVAGRGGVFITLRSAEFAHLRSALRAAMRAAGIEPPGRDDEPYRPHLTIAYATGPASRRATAARLGERPWPSPLLQVGAVHLLALRMVPPCYDWEVVALVPLGEHESQPRSALTARIRHE